MSYTFNNTKDLEYIKDYRNHKRWNTTYNATYNNNLEWYEKNNACTYKYLYGICYSNRFVKSSESKDTLNSFSIENGKHQKFDLICRKESNNESFTITAYIHAFNYNITIDKYTRTVDGKPETLRNYQCTGKIYKQLCFTVSDTLKYYYYTNKDKPNKGFPSEIKPNEVKKLWAIVKKSIGSQPTPNKIPLGSCWFNSYKSQHHMKLDTNIRIWDIKNHKHKWDMENFLNNIILMDFEHFIHPSCVQNLLYIYEYGSCDIVDQKENKLEFDEPKSFLQVIEEFETKDNHIANYVKGKLQKPLTGKETEEIKNYPELLLKKGTLTTLDDGRSYFSDRFLHIGKTTMYSYPLYAFRNIYVHDWIPNGSIYELHYIIMGKKNYQKNKKLKYKIKKRGKYIDPNLADKDRHDIYHQWKDDWKQICIEKEKRKEKRNIGREFKLSV